MRKKLKRKRNTQKRKRIIRRKRKDSKRKNSKIFKGPSFYKIPNPFADLDESERNKIIKEVSENSEDKYQRSLLRLKELLAIHEPKIILSMLTSYGLMVRATEKGVESENSILGLHQAHVEFCQALSLQINAAKLQHLPLMPKVFEEICSLLKEIYRSEMFRGLVNESKVDDENMKAIKRLQFLVRGNTQIIRNWGYYTQVKTILKEIYCCFDTQLENSKEFSITDTIEFFLFLVKEIEIRSSNRLKNLIELHKLKDKTQLVSKYYKLNEHLMSEAEKLFLTNLDLEKFSIDGLFEFLLSHYDILLYENYHFSPDEIFQSTGIEKSKVLKILNRFSYNWGDLESTKTDFFFLGNPIWLRPLIKDSENEFFCMIPQVFFSFSFRILDSLIEEVDKKALSERRSWYLENKIEELVNTRFPNSNTISGIKWKENGVEYETDLITFIDSYAIIVEAKSGKITDYALRGASERLKKHIKEILIEPNIQSKRLKEKLENLILNPEIEDSLRDKLPINLNNIHKVIRVSVSLENFASIQSNITQFRQTGWLPDDFEPCPTMSLANFEILFDILENPIQIIHYLERRQEIEIESGYLGDELDLIGMYLETLFNFGDVENNLEMVITEMSRPLDNYFESKEAGIDLAKPKVKMSSLFEDVFKQLKNRQFKTWSEIGVFLNRFSPNDQELLEKKLVELKKKVQKNWMKEGHENMLILVPPKASEYAICLVCYNNQNKDKKKQFMDDAFEFGLEEEHVKECVVIGINIDRNDLGYSCIGIVKK